MQNCYGFLTFWRGSRRLRHDHLCRPRSLIKKAQLFLLKGFVFRHKCHQQGYPPSFSHDHWRFGRCFPCLPFIKNHLSSLPSMVCAGALEGGFLSPSKIPGPIDPSGRYRSACARTRATWSRCPWSRSQIRWKTMRSLPWKRTQRYSADFQRLRLSGSGANLFGIMDLFPAVPVFSKDLGSQKAPVPCMQLLLDVQPGILRTSGRFCPM